MKRTSPVVQFLITVYKIFVAFILIIVIEILLIVPLNLISYLIVIVGIYNVFVLAHDSIRGREHEGNYPIDFSERPIVNYLLGATIFIWVPFWVAYLFLFDEEEYKAVMASYF